MAQQRILIFASDSRLCRLLLREARAAGFAGLATSELSQLEDYYRGVIPDLIFMEVDEPLENVERLLELASAYPGARLMLLSGVSGQRLGRLMLLAAARRVNIAGIVYKPVGIEAIRTALRHRAGNSSSSNAANEAGNQS
jgi:hypothetical protein